MLGLNTVSLGVLARDRNVVTDGWLGWAKRAFTSCAQQKHEQGHQRLVL
jgi:hypothetical protein